MDPKLESRIRANWRSISGKLKSRYGELVNDEDLKLEGDIQQTFGRLEKKTRKSIEHLEHEVEQILL